MKTILITGGLGYIGSHTAIELINSGINVIIADNLSNSEEAVLDRIFQITGIRPDFYKINVCNLDELNKIHANIDGVIHFAAYKSVNESVEKPLEYYANNINSLISILEFCKIKKIKSLVFSSSCTVYGQSEKLPITESDPFRKAWSPYGHTKQICEEIIQNYILSKPEMRIISLRYFNPAGAHESGLIGELPQGIPNNLLPYITQTAFGIREKINVFGSDYNTPDGTPIRDYIHVTDLAIAHIKAFEYSEKMENNSVEIFNIGSGNGYSVLEVIKSFEKVNNIKLPYSIVGRRAGDIEKIWADTSKAENILKFKPMRTLDDINRSAYNWEKHYRENLK
ncbi:MAG: UDP-glucose 4-epimerase GalE [Bacteroidales bacterium]|nr:UDP-glucose 4-epimerase GalE [Bacteroidales bacterium]